MCRKKHDLSVPSCPAYIYALTELILVKGHCSHYLVPLCVWSTTNTSSLSGRLISPDEGVWRAALTVSLPVDHVVSRWAGNTGGTGLRRVQGTAATLRGHTSNHIGDEDVVDLCKVCAVSPCLCEDKHMVSFTRGVSARHALVPAAKVTLIFSKWTQRSRLPSRVQCRNCGKNSLEVQKHSANQWKKHDATAICHWKF